MESLKDFLTPTTFSFYGYIVAVGCSVLVALFSASVGILRGSERRNFHCNVGSKSPFEKDFLRASCFNQYDQEYNSPLPLCGFLVLSCFIPTLISIVYSWCCVKSRVEEVERACRIDEENPRPRQTITTRRVFICYLTQLLIRLVLGILSTLLQNHVLYPSGFPTSFVCEMKFKEKSKVPDTNCNMTLTNSSFIDCTNSMGSDKDVWAMQVWIVNMLLVFLVAGEIIYLILQAYRNKSFMNDSEFCQMHLFNRRKTPREIKEYRMRQRRRIIKDTQVLDPLIPPSPGENEDSKNLDDVYVNLNLIIHTGRSRPNFDMEGMDKLRILEEYVKCPENSMKINKLEDLFLPNKDTEDKVPHKILILGCPGIGKTLLCKKLLQELSSGSESVQHDTRKFLGCCGREVNQSKPQFLDSFLFHFRNFNSEETKSMSLQTLLGKYSEGKLDKEILQYFLEHPEKILLVFDGLDEFKDHEDRIKEGMQHAGNGVSDDMPFAALYVKLVTGIFLNGATVITTTRPYAIDSVGGLKFDRTVEILGFSTENVEEYCTKFFKDDRSVMERIWNHVQSNLNLLYLCYIPVNCFIICSLLEKIVKLTTTSLQGVVLPTTLTEIYKGALRLFIFKHHPEHQGKTVTRRDLTSHGRFSSEIEDTLSKLETLAVKGIDERRLVFEVEEVQGMENCGLLNPMPDVQNGPFTYKCQYCFIHLTMQEFVAARGIAKMDSKDLQKFISSKAEDEKWHLVIQFVAGLLKGREAVVNEMFVKNLKDAFLSSGSRSKLALLMMKCLYEANDIRSVKRAAAELKSSSNFTNDVDLQYQRVTPVDCAAIVYFLKHVDNLEYLNVSKSSLGDGECSELSKLVEAGGPHKLGLQYCNIGDQGLNTILKAMETAKTCNLSQLNIINNHITVKGYSYLCDALLGGKCTITSLEIDHVLVNTDISLKLCNTLKHRNCKLSKLHLLGWTTGIVNVERGYVNLSSALVDKDCKLTDLALWVESIEDRASMSHLWEALKNENCKLTKLKLYREQITDEDILCVCEVLKHVNCRLTELHLGYLNEYFEMLEILGGQSPNGIFLEDNLYNITDLGVSYLCKALRHKDCKLTRLSVTASSIFDFTKKYFDDLQNAITHDNCKLQEFLYINDFYVERNLVKFTCHIVDSNGHKVLAKKGDSGQYEEISLSSLVLDKENYCDHYGIKIER